MITNCVNGKKYVGITSRSIKQRFNEHCKTDSYIGRAIRKYGESNFSITQIDKSSNWEELCEKEVSYIKEYDSFDNGYNQTIGGDGVVLKEDKLIEKTEENSMYINLIDKVLDKFYRNDIATPDEILLIFMKMFFISEFDSEQKEVSKAISKLNTHYKKRLNEFCSVICPDFSVEKFVLND